ncbi:DUF413 domain-containing protein [Alginatibacterium sediminis]|uniref:Macrodomain Ori protein n=1 Tax=Alginatibacterium sediminis TaxID=2164068 RepID=A0A420EN50_9ALTE|nr:DUF413 domain-containing protein [Alginatibacterium sediminis]RKF22073.1 DUF413 domain-containing protein [Alginatibacterium sediminis]
MSQAFESNRRFYDDKKFKRGFSRSGAFTIKEAELLERSGHAFKALDMGEREPSNEAEASFVACFRGLSEASNAEEKVWAKYKKLTGRKSFHGLVSNPAKKASTSAVTSDELDDIDESETVNDDDD